MNDHEAIDAITEIVESYGANGMGAVTALNRIFYILGANKISHNEAEEQS